MKLTNSLTTAYPSQVNNNFETLNSVKSINFNELPRGSKLLQITKPISIKYYKSLTYSFPNIKPYPKEHLALKHVYPQTYRNPRGESFEQ